MARRETLEWRDGGPFSPRFGDIYYSTEDGLAETEAVFLQGCALPGAWAGRERFVVAELGFGTGLNIAALLDLWSRTRPAGGRLEIFSIEAHPLSREDAARALGHWPRIADAADLLTGAWPDARRGFQRIEFAALNASLDLAVMEAAEALAAWSGKADAWFLDGFAPSKNPQAWRDEVLDLVAQRSAPGARLATFTVAGAVRRGLAARSFEVAKVAGHGRKRERLEARFAGESENRRTPSKVVVVGAGIAGASLCRALGAQGLSVQVVSAGIADGASGNRAALVTPALDAGGGARAAFYAQAFAQAANLYRNIPGAVLATGAVQVETEDRDRARFDAIAAQDIFEAGTVRRLSPAEVSQALNEPSARGGLWLENALTVAPQTILDAWLTDVISGEVTALTPTTDGWRLTLADGGAIDAEVVVIAAGWGAASLWPQLALLPIRGQASFAAGAVAPAAAAFGAYVLPAPGGVLFGATHDRGQADSAPREADDARNLGALSAVLPGLAATLCGPLAGRAAVRAATPDRMPLAGEVAPGLYVLGGLGSRGFTTAPTLSEHIAAHVCGALSPLPDTLATPLNALRFTPR